MGLYQKIREQWKKPQTTMPELWHQRLVEWRHEPTTVRIERPTRLDRARSLGYKAKQGFVLVRERVVRGGHTRTRFKSGRRTKTSGIRLNLKKNYQQVAEERVQRKFLNLAVLNSYWVAQDGKHYWFEVILVDPSHPVIKSDKNLQWLTERKRHSRVHHGQTSAGKKGRGLQR